MRLIKPEDELRAKGRARGLHLESKRKSSSQAQPSASSEVVFKVISHIKGGGKSARMINYVTRYGAGDEHKKVMDYISHSNEIVMRSESHEQLTHAQVLEIRERWGKEFEQQGEQSRVMSHVVFSSDKIKDAQEFADIVGKTLDKTVGRDGFEYLYAIHEEKDHQHCHVLINTHSKELDKKLHLSKAFCAEQRVHFAEISQEHGYQHHTSLKRDRAQAKELKPWEVDARAMDYVRLSEKIKQPTEENKQQLEQLKADLPQAALQLAKEKYARAQDPLYQSRLKQVRYLESVHKRGQWKESNTYKLLEVDHLNKDKALRERLTQLYPENVDKTALKKQFAAQQKVVAQIQSIATLKQLDPQRANRTIRDIQKNIPTVAMTQKYEVQMQKGLHSQVKDERIDSWNKALDRAQASLSKQEVLAYQTTIKYLTTQRKGTPKEPIIDERIKQLSQQSTQVKKDLAQSLARRQKERALIEQDLKGSSLSAKQQKQLLEPTTLGIEFAEKQLGITSQRAHKHAMSR